MSTGTRARRHEGTTVGIANVCAIVVILAVAFARADESIVNSKHDLSMFGPGPVRALGESEICIFCHVPHSASPAAPLWNRVNPQTYYRIYQSSTTDARIGQPTGASKMCLSCHDGSIALGMVLSRPAPIDTTHGAMPTGPSNLTNDLSDDHPIGFRYDRQLANRDRQIRVPELVDHRIKLGARGELECIACHDPHNNELGDFLRLPVRDGTLCNTCHQMKGWRASAHALSGKATPRTLGQDQPLDFMSIAENACANCHVAHGAAERERLLRARSNDLCLECHNGITAEDVYAVMGRLSGHKPSRLLNRHDPDEDPRTMRPHVACVDCHNPHAARSNPLADAGFGSRFFANQIPPAMVDVPGVTLSGVPIDDARLYYEVCFRCHADNPVPVRPRIIRDRDTFGNVRREFLPTAASAHPVTTAAVSTAEVPSLRPEYRGQPFIGCQDCHNNADAQSRGGGGTNGPHGSRYPWILADRYETADYTVESPQAYALCYQCHDRTSILGDESFPHHRVHIVDSRSPCSACHTAHGVQGPRAQHTHLINFDISIVQGARQFIDSGRYAGSCTLTCHGVQHVNFTYGR
jgi:predicted CXXCH cytochrome family protein